MPPATLTPTRPTAGGYEHERPAGPPPAGVAAGAAFSPFAADPATFDGAFVDETALEAARDAVARYLGELGLAMNSRPARTAINACLDAAFGDVGPDVGAAELSRVALRHAALGMPRWLLELSDRGPTPPRHAALAARLSAGRAAAVPALRHRAMTPQRFGR